MARKKKSNTLKALRQSVSKGKRSPVKKTSRLESKAVKHDIRVAFGETKSVSKIDKEDKAVVNDKANYYTITGGIAKTDIGTRLNERYFVDGKPHYNPQSIRGSLSSDQLSKEYSRLRNLAMKRLTNLERAGFSHTETYKQAKRDLRKIERMSVKNREDRLIQGIVTANRFLASEESTVRGMKKNINEWIHTMREKHGYNVTTENYQAIMDALNYLSDVYGSFIYDSDKAVEIAIDEVYEKVSNVGVLSMMKMHSAKIRDEIVGDIYERYTSDVGSRADLNKAIEKSINKRFS